MRVCNSCNQTIANPIQVMLARRESSREYICGSCVKRAHDVVVGKTTDDEPTRQAAISPNSTVEVNTYGDVVAYAILCQVEGEGTHPVPLDHLFASRQLAEDYANDELASYACTVVQVYVFTTKDGVTYGW